MVGEELEELFGAFVGAPRVLGLEDVFLEVLLENLETPAEYTLATSSEIGKKILTQGEGGVACAHGPSCHCAHHL